MFGDPHIRTLDGLEYTFNGIGEFVLVTVKDGEFVLQGRMEKPVSENEDIQATIFSAFVANGGATTVSIQFGMIKDQLVQYRCDARIVNITCLEHNFDKC